MINGKYRFNHIYRAKVVNNNDELQLGRLQVKVYPFMERLKDSECPWATPCWQAGILYIPPVNSWVWVFFEEGDSERPVWLGWSTPFNSQRFQDGSTWAEFGKGAMDSKGMYEELKAEYPGAVVLRFPMGSYMVFYANGAIEIRSVNKSYIRIHEDGRITIDALGRRIDLNP